MRISLPVVAGQHIRAFRLAIIVLGALVSVVSVSAHVVKGLGPSGSTSAFVSSPTNTADLPIQVRWGSLPADDTGLRIVCFHVANTSQPRADRPDWPRITGVGFELPGSASGFALIDPLDGKWRLEEGVATLAGHGPVTLDFAIVAAVNPTGRTPGYPHDPAGIPPGQQGGVRGVGTRFCVSGPFPDTLPGLMGPTTIERILNGVVVGFHGVDDAHQGTDAGVWFPTPAVPNSPPRMIPLYQ